jgi:hypothetical protein
MREQLPFGLREAGLTDYRTLEEREFLEALHTRAAAAGWYADAWPRTNCITLSVIVNDSSTGQLLKTLRIDFNGSDVVLGYDATHQLVDEREVRTSGDACEPRSIRELATEAADWIEEQLAVDHSQRDDHAMELPATATRRKPFW